MDCSIVAVLLISLYVLLAYYKPSNFHFQSVIELFYSKAFWDCQLCNLSTDSFQELCHDSCGYIFTPNHMCSSFYIRICTDTVYVCY